MKTIRRRLLSDRRLWTAQFLSAVVGCVSPDPSPLDVWNVFRNIVSLCPLPPTRSHHVNAH